MNRHKQVIIPCAKALIIALLLTKGGGVLSAQTYVPKPGDPRFVVQPVAKIQMLSFEPDEVILLPSPFLDAMKADVQWLKYIEPDRLLSQFRTHAGLEAKARKYGGWESDGLAGHSLGHYLSACALYYKYSGDKEILERLTYMVEELAICQRARKTGYVGAIPNEDKAFAEVAAGNIRSHGFDLNGMWAPWYTIHKIMGGLLDVYIYTGIKQALQVEEGMADWAIQTLSGLDEGQIQQMLRCEYGGMNEVLVNTYALSGNKKYLDLSYKFHDHFVLDSLAKQVDVLPGKHSNTQVPKIIGTVRRYELTGEQKDLEIGKFFWNTMINHHTYAPGGNSNYEYLGPEDQLSEKLTDNTMETCNTHNMLKLTRHLFAMDPRASWMDFYERALYNHILASQNRENGMVCYFVPLRMGTKKEFSDEEHSFTCCVGTGMENHVKYGEAIFSYNGANDLFVNLFIPSVLDWKTTSRKLKLESDLLHSPEVKLTLDNVSGKETFTVHFRKPSWTQGLPKVFVNGKEVKSVELSDAGYFGITRKWKANDVISFDLDIKLRAMAMPDNANRQAFFYGPYLLAGDLGTAEPNPVKGIPALVTNADDVNQWIQSDFNRSNMFFTSGVGQPEDVGFRPFYSFYDNFYSVYWDVYDEDSWEKEKSVLELKRKERADLEARTVDFIRLGEMQPERDHKLTGEKTITGDDHLSKWRLALRNGYFEFEMKLDDRHKSYDLLVNYWGMDNRYRKFEIEVDGTSVGTEDLNKMKESRFYEMTYPIPDALTAGKEKIVIGFKPLENNEAGPVYNVRLVGKP